MIAGRPDGSSPTTSAVPTAPRVSRHGEDQAPDDRPGHLDAREAGRAQRVRVARTTSPHAGTG